MHSVYEASNAIEAHMLVVLLAQQGIAARIQGEHLQGAIGELPAGGLVRVLVEAADQARAREILQRWDATQVPEPSSPPTGPLRTPKLLGCLALGLALGFGGGLLAFTLPTGSTDIDHNGDGVPDETWVLSPAGTVLRHEVDRNLDGKVDYIGKMSREGVLEESEQDDDFNGSMETRTRYRYRNALTSWTDTDGDGFADLVTYYRHGVSASAEYLDPATRRPLRREHYRLGKLTEAEVDTDGDGRLDTRLTYSPLAQVVASQPIPR